MARSFDELVDEAAAVPVEGWGFSWLEGRATEQRPSWGYQRLLGEKLAAATAGLDIQTGGGEVLAGAGAENFPPTLVATEGWPPNLARATALLHPLGAAVVADHEEPPLPFADDAFDLVTSRHPTTVHWSEIARVLAPGGTYFAQHVGGGTNLEISEYFLGPLDQGGGRQATAKALEGGWLHTGDVAIADEEGFLFLVDRKKDMIRSGGQNVYSKEIEDCLLAHAVVAECGVIGLPDPRYEEKVCAVIVLAPGSRGDEAMEDELRRHVRASLAGYNTPREFRFVDELPRNAVGKVQKHILREEFGSMFDVGAHTQGSA